MSPQAFPNLSSRLCRIKLTCSRSGEAPLSGDREAVGNRDALRIA